MVEAAFREILKSHFPRIKFHGDKKDDDICVRAGGYWECERLFYNRSTEQIRMWRWKGQCDYHFTSDDEFIHWLVKHVNAGHKFEEIEKPKPSLKVKHTIVTGINGRQKEINAIVQKMKSAIKENHTISDVLLDWAEDARIVSERKCENIILAAYQIGKEHGRNEVLNTQQKT